jgi:carboxymethylenebutenolidase
MNMEQTEHLASLFPVRKFERRAFLVTSIGAGFALAVQPVSSQTITTDSAGLAVGEVKVPVKDGELPAYRAMPDAAGPFATILVVHEIWGVHEHIQDICRRLAKLGYYALAPDLFARYGDVSKMEASAIVQNVMSKLTAEQAAADLDACVAFAKASGKADTQKLAVIGFCFGGTVVWQYAARNRALKTGVAWYGSLTSRLGAGSKTALELAPELTVPVLGLYGGKDQGIPLAAVEQMRAELKEAANPSQIIVYPEAGHAFLADYRPSYNKAAAEDAWKKMLEWLKYYGVK